MRKIDFVDQMKKNRSYLRYLIIVLLICLFTGLISPLNYGAFAASSPGIKKSSKGNVRALQAPLADLVLTKTVDNSSPNVNDDIVYTITVTNNGPDNATNVQVTDVLPAEVSYISHTTGEVYDYNGTGIWSVGSLASGASKVLKITVSVDVGAPAIDNTASITNSDLPDPDTTNNQATVTVTPLVQVDLSLDQTVDNTVPNVGDNVIFTITVNNTNLLYPNDATNVEVKDLLPTGLSYVSDDSASTGTTYDSSTGIWTVGTVASGTSQVLNLTAKVTTSGTNTNWAEVWKSDQKDPNSTPGNGSTTENDAASATVMPQVADLSITKTIDNVNPSMGTDVVFTVTVSNAGPDDATNVQVKDLLPTGLLYVSDNSAFSGTTYSSGTGIWMVGTLTASGVNSSKVLKITATVNTSVAVANWAEVWTSDQYDPDSTPGNGSRTEDDAAGAPSADLSLTNTVSNASPGMGGSTTFTLTVSNAGPGGATNVQVKDLLPTGLGYVSDTGSGSYNSNTGIWTVGSLTKGANKTLTITAKATNYGEQINWAEVWKSDQPDPDSVPGDGSTTTDDDASAAVSVPFPPKYVIINEVAWAGTVASSSDKWIELYNPTAAPVNLTGWKLNAVDGSPAINLNGVIPANGYFLLGTSANIFSKTDIPPVTVDQTFSGTLGTYGEILQLFDSTNTIVDTANSDGGYWPAGLGYPTYASMERFNSFTDGKFSWGTFSGTIIAHDKYGYPIQGSPKHSNWIITTTLTPTATPRSTSTPRPTPTRTPSYTLVGRPIINEFLPRPNFDWNQDGRVDVFDEFIEIKNIGPVDINIGGWQLDDEPNAGSKPYTIPKMVLKPGQRAVFYGLQTNILLGDGGDTVRLLNPVGKVYDAYTYPVVKVEDRSYCRLPDGNGIWYADCIPTPNMLNTRKGTVPSMPNSNYQSPVCDLPDTLPPDFLFAECHGYGANIWRRMFWDAASGQGDRNVPEHENKWESFVQ